MISYLMVGTNDIAKATVFYDALMSAMGASKAYSTDRNVGWGWGIGTPLFILTTPHNNAAATSGNGSMIAFDAANKTQVDEWHALVLEHGGTSEGEPGMRGEHMCVAYWRDLDGNKFNFIHYLPAVEAAI